MKRKGLKTVLATIVCIFNLFVCFSGVLAWFAANRQTESGMQIQMSDHDLNMAYHVYKYDDDQKCAIDATNQADALTLPKYDSVITSRNVNTPIILEFVITGENLVGNLPININTHCTDTSTTNRVLSNIVQLQFAPISNIASSNANEIYTSAVNYFNENSINEVVFKEGNTKNNDVLYTLSNYGDSIVNNALYVYIKLDYSVSLVSNFEFSITDANTTSFANDLTEINCYTNEN